MPIQRIKEEFQKKILRPQILVPFFAFVAFMFIFVIPNWNNIKGTFFIGMFFFLGSLSYFYRRFFEIRLGVEFISVGTFLCTLVYGVPTGLFIGNVSSFLAELIGAKVDERILVNLFSINALVFVTPFLKFLVPDHILIAALMANFVYNLIGVGGNLILGGNPGKTIVFVSTNVFWTVAFFLQIGPIVYSIMTG